MTTEAKQNIMTWNMLLSEERLRKSTQDSSNISVEKKVRDGNFLQV